MLSILTNRLLQLFSTKGQTRRGGLSAVRAVPIQLENLEHRAMLSSAPVITTQPTDQTGINGQPVTFSVTFSGTATVQWQVSTDLGQTFQSIAGATSNSYTVTSSFYLSNNRYRAVLTSPDDPTHPVISNAATLSISNPASAPLITQQPNSVSAGVGDSVSFFALATGTPAPTVQWQVSISGGAFTDISGATTTQYTFTTSLAQYNTPYKYRAVFTNSAGQTISNVVNLNIFVNTTKPKVTTDPAAVTVDSGEFVTMTSVATGGALTTAQWLVSADSGKTFDPVNPSIYFTSTQFLGGNTITKLFFNSTIGQNSLQFEVIFTNPQGTATSKTATLTVNGDPEITLQPTDQTVGIGQTATFVAFAGGNPTPTVQWQSSVDGITWTDIQGATTPVYSFATDITQNNLKFRANFTSGTKVLTTNVVTLHLITAPSINSDPASQSVTVGQTASFTVNFTSNAPAPATIQWMVSANGGAFAPIPGATSPTYSFVTSLSQSGNQYEAVVTNSVGSTTSLPATLTVLPLPSAPQITSNPSPQSVLNNNTATFAVGFTANPAATVQWQVSTNNGVSYSPLAGQTLTVLSFIATTSQNGNLYRAIVTNANGSVTSTGAKLSVAAIVIDLQPKDQVLFAGSPVTFTANATGVPTPTVQWQVSTDQGVTFSNIAGATSNTYTIVATSLSQTGNKYRAIFTNASGTVVTSVATLTVVAGSPQLVLNPQSQSTPVGKTVTFAAAANPPKAPANVNPALLPAVTVQWQVSTNGGKTFSNVLGATSKSLTVGVASALNGYQYRAVFKSGSGSTTTAAATLTALTAPVVTVNPANVTATKNQVITLTAAAAGNPTPMVQWQVSTDGGKTYTNIAGATSTTLKMTATAQMNGYLYRAAFSNSVASKVLSKAAKLTVK